jgi:3-isopropylmalate/(R)-2-methylmalate dehydratase small subunit
VVCPDTDKIPDGAEVTVDIKEHRIVAGARKFIIEPVPVFMQGIVDAGGLVEYAKGLKEVPGCTGSRR